MLDFVAWPKIPRLFKPMVVTEKIDGTNAAVIIENLGALSSDELSRFSDVDMSDRCTLSTFLGSPGEGKYKAKVFDYDNQVFVLAAQSRNRLITPEADNSGFAAWAFENYLDIFRLLGVGRHYGEWWGSGIQRGYGLEKGEKVFSLFNRHRYPHLVSLEAEGVTGSIRLVPLLAEGPFDLDDVRHILADLRKNGSKAAPGYMNPEGAVVFHEAGRQVYKAFVEELDGESRPKSQLIWDGGALPPLSDSYFEALAREPRGFA
jgi:RNA ligase-like protein